MTWRFRASPEASPWIRSGVPTICPTRWRGLRDAYGSWKIICISRRSGCIARPRSADDLLPFEAHRAGGGRDQLQDGAAERRFAGARLADEAECLAFLDGEADAVDGAHAANFVVEDDAGLDREVLDEVADLEQAAFGAARSAPSLASDAPFTPPAPRARSGRPGSP